MIQQFQYYLYTHTYTHIVMLVLYIYSNEICVYHSEIYVSHYIVYVISVCTWYMIYVHVYIGSYIHIYICVHMHICIYYIYSIYMEREHTQWIQFIRDIDSLKIVDPPYSILFSSEIWIKLLWKVINKTVQLCS